MTSIFTLIPDIQALLAEKLTKVEFTAELGQDSSYKPTLRLSQMGDRCPCALWHSIHKPELAEKLPPQALFKYGFGHMIEAAVIKLAKEAGHEVTGEQDHVELDGISGHRDCVIDGCIVDVKSASSFSFAKFKDKSIATSDSFGYLSQLDGYLLASRGDPLVRDYEKAYLLAVDKQLGSMCLYEHSLREAHIRARIAEYKQIVARDTAPKCTCGVQPDGESGNIKLDTNASYSAFKFVCFPNLRTFLYSGGPRYLTKVVRTPSWKGQSLIEVDKNGKLVYNS